MAFYNMTEHFENRSTADLSNQLRNISYFNDSTLADLPNSIRLTLKNTYRTMSNSAESEFNSAIEEKLRQAGANITLVGALNDSANSNDTMRRMLGVEYNRISKSLRSVDRDHHLLSERLKRAEYRRITYQSTSLLVELTMFMTLVAFALFTSWRMKWVPKSIAITIMILFVISYLVLCIWSIWNIKMQRTKRGFSAWTLTSSMKKDITKI